MSGDNKKKGQQKSTFNPWQEHQERMMGMAKDFFQNPKAPDVNPQQFLASQKKNLETLNEASKTAVDVMKSITQLQGQYMRQAFEDMNAFMRTAMTMSPDQAGAQYQSQKLQESLEKAVDHGKNVASVVAKSGKNIQERIQKRAEESLNEMKAATQAKH